jgi:hypothetical protein
MCRAFYKLAEDMEGGQVTEVVSAHGSAFTVGIVSKSLFMQCAAQKQQIVLEDSSTFYMLSPHKHMVAQFLPLVSNC